MPKMSDQDFELLMNGLTALIMAIPQIIAMIQDSTIPNKDELLSRIKKAQESWPVWE